MEQPIADNNINLEENISSDNAPYIVLIIAREGTLNDLKECIKILIAINIFVETNSRYGMLDFIFENDFDVFYLVLQAIKILKDEEFITEREFLKIINGVSEDENFDNGLVLYDSYRTYYSPIIMWVLCAVGTQIDEPHNGIFGSCIEEINVDKAKRVINFLITNGASIYKKDYYETDAITFASSENTRNTYLGKRHGPDAEEIYNYLLLFNCDE